MLLTIIIISIIIIFSIIISDLLLLLSDFSTHLFLPDLIYSNFIFT